MMRKAWVKIWRLSFFANFMFTLLVFYPIFKILFSTPRFYSAALWLQRHWAAWLMFCAGIRTSPQYAVHTEGTGPYIWCPNHTSALDILEMYAVVLNEFHFVANVVQHLLRQGKAEHFLGTLPGQIFQFFLRLREDFFGVNVFQTVEGKLAFFSDL